MSLKKTWFSDVLWFLFAVPAAFISYCILTVEWQDFYAMISSYIPWDEFYVDLIAKILTVLAVVPVVLLLRLICSKVKTPSMPKWLGVTGHILFCAGIITVFCVLRYASFLHAWFLQSYSSALSPQAACFYELSKVGAVFGQGTGVGTMSVLEQAYTYVLHGIFLFFGNKIEVLFVTQLIMQVVTFILLMVIGWNMQKGIFAWIPALLYAVLPSFFYTAEDTGITNFWIFVVILFLAVICLLEKAWKKKNITYLVMVFAQLLFAGFIFYAKMGVLLYAKAPFVSGGTTPGEVYVLDAEMIALAVLLIMYCVTFYMDKQDHRILFVLPFIGYGFLAVWLSNYEFEASYCMMLLALVNLFFMISQSMRIIFRTKPVVVTGNPIPANAVDAKFEWEEMQEVMHSTEGIEVRKEEPLKVELALTEVVEEDKKETEQTVPNVQDMSAPIDRKAPIENVLPMPKKHKPKVLDYAFEPSEDMMHFDIEIENDEYDY